MLSSSLTFLLQRHAVYIIPSAKNSVHKFMRGNLKKVTETEREVYHQGGEVVVQLANCQKRASLQGLHSYSGGKLLPEKESRNDVHCGLPEPPACNLSDDS